MTTHEDGLREALTVTQADRDAAAGLMRSMPLGGLVGSAAVMEGENDGHRFVKAFARHRIAALSTPKQKEASSDLAEALEVIAPFAAFCSIADLRVTISTQSNSDARLPVLAADDFRRAAAFVEKHRGGSSNG